jgi:phosphate transport system substrate-binding protein
MRTKKWGMIGWAGVGLLALSASAYALVQINAAGATFPAAIYQKWFEEFKKSHSDVQINYQPIGSGAGVRQLTEATIDFGASDFPMKDEDIAKMTKFHVLHFPTVLGGVVITYNVEGVSKDLNLTGPLVADIFSGKVTKWNDSAIAKINPGVKLPNDDITVVHRSDGSGTTFVFTDYLSNVSPEWKSKIGTGSTVSWPAGLGQKGNEGIAGQVKQSPGAIGYVELFYAIQNKMPYAALQNKSGKFLKATLDSVTAAAAGAAKSMPDDFRVSIVNALGENAYPLSTFTYLLIPDKIPDAGKKKAVVDFLHWMLTTGQSYAAPLSYAPLPKTVVSKEEAQIAKIH